MSFHVPEQFRVTTGRMASDSSYGNNGAFRVKAGTNSTVWFNVIASDGMKWEHVSVSLPHRAPTWAEMCLMKSLFWDEEDCVVQYHPPERDYQFFLPYQLHLFRPVSEKILTPDFSKFVRHENNQR